MRRAPQITYDPTRETAFADFSDGSSNAGVLRMEEVMKEFRYVITDQEGIHVRPAGLFVKEAAQCQCNVTISADGKVADAKRIFSVMGLGVKKDQEIVLTTEGADEDEAIEKLSTFLKENL